MKKLLYLFLILLVIPSVYANVVSGAFNHGIGVLNGFAIGILVIELLLLFFLVRKLNFWYVLLTVFLANLASYLISSILNFFTTDFFINGFLPVFLRGYWPMIILLIISILIEWPVLYYMIKRKLKVDKYKVLFYSLILNIVTFALTVLIEFLRFGANSFNFLIT